MKRTTWLFTVLALAALLAAPLSVAAQSGIWVSGIMIQNQSTTAPANITVTFYWAEGETLAGQIAGTKTDVIPAGKAVTYYIPDLVLTTPAGQKLPDNFVGSAVVTSDQPVVANVNTQVPTSKGLTPTDPNRVGTASGVLVPAGTLFFTQVMKNYWDWNSYLAIQNTSAFDAAVTVRYYNSSDGSPVTGADQTITIKPNTTYIVRQESASMAAPDPGGWGGSAVVTCTNGALLAGVANFYNLGTNKDNAQFHSYNPFTAGSTKLYVPRLVKDYYDYQGGMAIQNVGTAATDVTITYYFGAITRTQTISGLQPGASSILYMPDQAALAGVAGSGSAVITSSGQPIVAIVNEDNRVGAAIPNQEGRGSTYNAALDGEGTTSVFFSQVTSRYFGYSSGIQVQNVGAAATTVTAVFSAAGFTDATVTATLQPNQSESWFAPNVVSGVDFNGSVVVTSSGEPIVGITNMSSRTDVDPRWPTNYGDSFLQYNGVNK